ncbi:MAG: sodium:glutamate symporter [Eubacteriales bacterium]
MDVNWLPITDFLYLSLFLAGASFLKKYVKLFNKLLIPTSIVAGFLGLFLGPEIIGVIPTHPAILEIMVYHLMAIGFIALTLKERNHKMNSSSIKTGIIIVSTYLVQGIIGFGISLTLLYTIAPDIFPTFGLLLPLGYGQGPGQSYSIGRQWEVLGFQSGGQIGLTIATLGFLWACFGGILLLNILVKNKKLSPSNLPLQPRNEKITDDSEPGEIPLSSGLDKITVQLFLIGIVYFFTLLTLKGLTSVLTPLGSFGETMAQLFWGFHFIIGTLYAMLLRLFYDYLLKKKLSVTHYPNNYLLQRISGACFDFMITASIAAISITAIKNYLLPVALVSTMGTLVTMLYIIYICRKRFHLYVMEHIIALYGMLTGTISTGLALLKEVDPHFSTQVAENLVLGSAVGLFFGLPLMMILNIPIMGYINNDPVMYLYTMAALIAYFILLSIILYFVNSRKD